MSSKSKNIPISSCQSIYVESKIFQIQLTGCQGNDICVRWYNTGVRKVHISENAGKLEIKESDLVSIYGVLGLIELTRDKELIIEIPPAFTGDITINAAGGEHVKIDRVQTSGIIDIQTRTRTTILNAIKAMSIRVEAKHTGSINANNIQCDREITLNTVAGAIICGISEPVQNYSVGCYSKRGRCNVPTVSHDGGKTLRINSVSGNISVQFAKD